MPTNTIQPTKVITGKCRLSYSHVWDAVSIDGNSEPKFGACIIIPKSDKVTIKKIKAAVEAAYHYQGPVYMRFGRLAVPVINDTPDYKFELGKGVTLRDGDDITIIATGLLVAEAVMAADALKDAGIHARVINIHTIKPLDKELVIKAAKETGRIITAEEHNIIGGLGEAVCSAVCDECPVPVTRIGVNDEFGHSGPAVELLKQFGLSAEHIADVAKKVLKK